MATPSLEPGHAYYGSELDILSALSHPKGRSCPVVVGRTHTACEWSIGRSRTHRIMYLLEDLQFHKSNMADASHYNDTYDDKFFTTPIARIAWLIAQNTFCSKHDPDFHEAELKTRFNDIYHRALKCTLFSDPAGDLNSNFKSFDQTLPSSVDSPHTPPNLQTLPSLVDSSHAPPTLKRARDDRITPPQQSPSAKRARRSVDQNAPAWWDSTFGQSLHVGTPQGEDVPAGGYADVAKDLENFDHNPPPPPFNPTALTATLPLGTTFCDDTQLWSPANNQRAYDIMREELDSNDHVDVPDSQAQSPSAAKLARIHSVQASSTKRPIQTVYPSPPLLNDWWDPNAFFSLPVDGDVAQDPPLPLANMADVTIKELFPDYVHVPNHSQDLESGGHNSVPTSNPADHSADDQAQQTGCPPPPPPAPNDPSHNDLENFDWNFDWNICWDMSWDMDLTNLPFLPSGDDLTIPQPDHPTQAVAPLPSGDGSESQQQMMEGAGEDEERAGGRLDAVL
ncbi:hypothetical protein TI39_contig400g00001 [Zymoseptoria brevis]|uniref:Uncharacterized protein n=1 Tax=Zymoseptoria brevis TaxID=1047168 RepID=A0A0F4GR00_9PEZI|nr:hypothetical protein TI39_contig400g00001 [Zymoseptoria brevis]